MLSSVHTNVDRIVSTTADINSLYAEADDEHLDTLKLISIQDDVAKKLTQLKKNQESLSKALGRKRKILDEIKLKGKEMDGIAMTACASDSAVELSSSEVLNMVQDIIVEDQEPTFTALEEKDSLTCTSSPILPLSIEADSSAVDLHVYDFNDD